MGNPEDMLLYHNLAEMALLMFAIRQKFVFHYCYKYSF